MSKVAARTDMQRPTPFHKDPNMWTLFGVLFIQAVVVVVATCVSLSWILLDAPEVCFPFLAYERVVSLPGVFILAIFAVFAFVAIIKVLGRRGKVIVRWTIIALALGSAILALGHILGWLNVTMPSDINIFDDYHF